MSSSYVSSKYYDENYYNAADLNPQSLYTQVSRIQENKCSESSESSGYSTFSGGSIIGDQSPLDLTTKSAQDQEFYPSHTINTKKRKSSDDFEVKKLKRTVKTESDYFFPNNYYTNT